MSRPIENSMTLSALQDLIPQHKMNEAFDYYEIETGDEYYTHIAKACFNLSCDELKQSKTRAALHALGLATQSNKLSSLGKRFLWIAYGGRL